MKILIAVVNSRNRQSTWADAIRSTWKPLVEGADVRFFVGRGSSSVPEDTVELDCDDSYQGLPEKIREIFRWAYANGYDFALKCDDDVVLDPNAMLSSDFKDFDYSGRRNRPPTHLLPFWVPVGFNYWLSKQAMQHVINAPLPSEGNDDEKWVAVNLYAAGIGLHDDQRYRLQYGELTLQAPDVIIHIHRPLRGNVNTDVHPDTFSWCIFLEGNSGNLVATERKLEEFHKIFKNHVKVTKN